MAQQMIDGQKAGSGSSRQPVIAPDSASSVTKLKMAVGLSEGEIEGFTRADVKLDGTPLTELSSDIVCDYRFGTNDQEYIPGIDEVANEIGVGVELTGATDWVKLITNQDIDHVGIRLRWGPLQTNHSNGDIAGVSITYEVYIAAVGGSYERVLSTTLSDKTSDSYERYHEFKLPESDSGWMVRVIRVTPSAQSSLVSDKMYVQAYSEIIKSKFTFPYTSLVYLEYDAKTFSNVAKVAVKAKGLIIKVPSNYDPVTRQYSGLWSGTFKMAYTNNPAWVYYDLVTNPRYGCGDRIDSSMVDKWSLYKLGQYCDQMVDDGYGGLEPRFTCNVYLQSKERAYDILNRLTGLFRAINFWNGSQLVVDADIPQDTSYLYTNANVVDGLFEYAGTAATDLYSAAKVAWDNPANGYNTEYEAVSYEHLVKKLGFKTLELDAWGCTSRGQALRAGRWALLAESDTVTFKVGMDGYLAMPGKIIEIQDEFYAGKSNGGRVISIDPSRKVITLDRQVTTISGDTISFNSALDGIKKYNIVSSAGSVVTVSESIDPSIENMHIWAINSSQLATQKYRILTVKYDGVGEFTISAVEYNPNKYEEIDSNIKFDEPPTSVINPVVQAAVQNVVITPSDFIYQGLNTVNLEIKWDRAENAVEYLVELKKDDGSWLKLPVTGNNSITLENVYAGAYIARVIAVSAFELKSLPTYSIKTTVSGKQSAPLPPINLRSVSIMFGTEFYWDFPPNSSDTAVSRVAISYVEPGLDVDESTLLIYDKAYSDNKIVIQNLDIGTTVWVKVKLIDKLGLESAYTGWVSGQPSQDVDKVLDLVSGHISESTLDQILRGKIDGALGLAGEANSLASQANTVAGNASFKAQEAADAVTQEAINRAAALQAGISQVTTDYTAADSVIYGELNAYKASNDSAVATVVQKAESAVATGMTNSQSITELTGQVQAINSTKLDASVIANYYTKGQADDKSAEIAAGKIESYNAKLVIGGTNLLLNSNFSEGVNSAKWGDNGGGYVKVNDPIYGSVVQTQLPNGLAHSWLKLENNVEYTYSALVKPSNDLYMDGRSPLHYWAGKDDNNQQKIQILSTSHTLIEAGKWSRISMVFKLTDDANTFRPFIFGLSGVLQIAWTKLERGNKATDWAPNSLEMKQSIDANASAVQSTRAEVLRIDGVVTSQASQLVSLESSKVALENGGIVGNNEIVIDLTDPAYSRDLYYPILLSGFSTEYRQTIRVMATLDGKSVPTWASHSGGFALNAQFQMGGDGWGTINPEIVTDNFSYAWTHYVMSPLDEIGQITPSSQPFFYVRGGGYYRLSKPVNRSVQVCAPNGSLSGSYGGTLYPRAYQAGSVPKSINQGLNQQTVKLQQTNTVLDGVKAVSTVTVDNNGVMSGYGLISELANGQVRSSFGVNADTFYIGAPSGGRKPFIQRNEWSQINGVWVPPGTYIDTAYIGNSTIGTAHINDLAVTTAKIGDSQITTAKIGDLQVDTLKIKDNAVTVPAALNDETARTRSATYNSHSYGNPDQVLADVATIFGDLASITINRNGGKCRVDASVTVATIAATTTRNGGYISGVAGSMYCGIILYRNGTPVKYFKVSAPFVNTREVNVYSGTVVMPIFLDDAAYGATTYTIRFGVSTTAAGGAIQIHPTSSGYGTATVVSSSIAIIEMKK